MFANPERTAEPRDVLIIEGGVPLRGVVEPQGAKNEALQVLCASVAVPGISIIRNVPDVVDVRLLAEALTYLNVQVQWMDPHTLQIDARTVSCEGMKSPEFAERIRRIRGGVMLAGAMLSRTGEAYLPQPGGDKIGRRRLDTHLEGFRQMGVDVRVDFQRGMYAFRVHRWEVPEDPLWMLEPSVTGTTNLILAGLGAVHATGKSLSLYNCACEPYIQQTVHFLRTAGFSIQGEGTNRITLDPTAESPPEIVEHTIAPDIIEIGSFIGLAALTQSDLTIRNVPVRAIPNILRTFRKLGIQIEEDPVAGEIRIPPQEIYRIETSADGSILTVYDAPWPGFPADLISVVLVTAIQAEGSLLVHQKMFESRLFFVDTLIDMGAQIILCDPHRATVVGLARRFPLRGIRMSSPDIRAGIAMLMAALAARGTSVIQNAHQIDRGYQAIDERLRKLGARIWREPS